MWVGKFSSLLFRIILEGGLSGSIIVGKLFSCSALFISLLYEPGLTELIIWACIIHAIIFVAVSFSKIGPIEMGVGGFVLFAACEWVLVEFSFFLTVPFFLNYFLPLRTLICQSTMVSQAVNAFFLVGLAAFFPCVFIRGTF